MKKYLYKSVVCLLLFCLTGGLLLRFHQVFNFKYNDGMDQVAAFYKQEPNTVDVLTLGSSRAFVNVNTAVLWEEHGFSSFNLCSSVQPLWNTFYYLKEALKTQTPSVIILDAHCASISTDYYEEVVTLKSTFALKPSLNKVQALKESVPEERRLAFGLEYIQYHSRYKTLTKNDFSRMEVVYGAVTDPLSSWKGTTTFNHSTPFPQRIATPPSTEYTPLHPKSEEYLRKIIALAQSRGIPLLLVQAPMGDEDHRIPGIMNEVARIAAEYQVPFVDFDPICLELMDFSTDFTDFVHLSYTGSEKYTRKLGEYLSDNYEIPDRRGDAAYRSWDENAACYRSKIQDWQLQATVTDANTYLNMIAALPDHYLVFLSLDGNYAAAPFDVQAALQTFGIPPVDGLSSGAWVRSSGDLVASFSGAGPYHWASSEGNDNLAVDQIGLYCDRMNYKKVVNGLNILVYDRLNASIADAIGFDSVTGGAVR